MPDPFDSKVFEKPFEVFFGDHVVIETKRSGLCSRQTCAAWVVDGGFADPMSDLAVETSGRVITVHVAKTGPLAWNDPNPPQIGDVITLVCGVSFAVTKRDDLVTDHYQLEAKQT